MCSGGGIHYCLDGSLGCGGLTDNRGSELLFPLVAYVVVGSAGATLFCVAADPLWRVRAVETRSIVDLNEWSQ